MAALQPSTAAVTFVLTPHKVSICVLLQMYAVPSQTTLPFPFSSVSQHNRLGLYLLALTKSVDDFVEPKLEELIGQLREVTGSLGQWMVDQLTARVSSLSSPDDLFNFFGELRGVLAGADSVVLDENQVFLEPSSHLGMFLRRCVLAFNLLGFEGVCRLLTNIGMYCKDVLSSCMPYELHHVDDSGNDIELLSEEENMDLENFVFRKVTEEIEARKQSSKKIPFHLHAPKAISALVEDVEVVPDPRYKHSDRDTEGFPSLHSSGTPSTDCNHYGELFLRTSWQVQGFLMEQADSIEKHGGSSFYALDHIMRQIKNLAPELYRVHLLNYLNSLYHDDYFAALENLHCYFDYSAGTEGSNFVPPSQSVSTGRYEVGLLFLGMMHMHFGHPKQALEALIEAVRFSQEQSDESCIAYSLAAICNLLSEISGSSMVRILGPSYLPATSMGVSLSVKQQLFVLLKMSLKRAEIFRLKRLVASNHLAMANFHLKHVQRPLLSFGPKISIKLRTCPINVCKELRLCSHLIREFGSESSAMTIDGVFSSAWLNSLSKPMSSLVFSEEIGSGNNSNTWQFSAQPSSVPNSVLQLVGSSYLQRASAWEIYGSAPLARIYALVYATCYADASSLSDAALAHAKLIQHLAAFQGYREAFVALKLAEEKFFSITRSVILPLKLQLLHEHALHRGHLKFAQQVCDELGVLASSVAGVDMTLKIEASLRHARTLLAAKQFSQSAAVAHSLFRLCHKFNMQIENASVLLLFAEIHKKSGNAVLGIPYALACISFCQSFNLNLLKASATLTLAELWLSLGTNHAKRSLTLIHGALPMILGHGGLELCARAQIAEAKCYLSDSSYSVLKDPDIILEPLRQASDDLQALEFHELAAEAFYLMAMIFDKLGQLGEREEAAASFKKHITALESPQDQDDPLFNML